MNSSLYSYRTFCLNYFQERENTYCLDFFLLKNITTNITAKAIIITPATASPMIRPVLSGPESVGDVEREIPVVVPSVVTVVDSLLHISFSSLRRASVKEEEIKYQN